MNKTIAVLVLAALIVAAFAIIPPPSVHADASEARVVSYSWYTSSVSGGLAANAGDIVVVGEIENVGSNIIDTANVTANAYNSAGEEIGTALGMSFTYETLPGDKAPFSIDMTPDDGTTGTTGWLSSVTNVTVSVYSVTDTSSQPYMGLTTPQTPTGFNDGGDYTVVGTIVNTGSQEVGDVWVVTTFYDAAGTVVGFNYTDYLVTSLPVGAPTRWVATPIDNTAQLSDEITNFSYAIDSAPLANSNTQSQTGSTPTPTPKPGASSGFPTLIVAVIAVIVVVAVVALVLIRKRQAPTQPPTEATTEPAPPPPPPPPTE